MTFLSELLNRDAGKTLDLSACSSLVQTLERQFKAGPDDPVKPMRIQGQDELVRRLTMSVILNEHVLLEGLPGVAKTTAVELLAEDTGLGCSRIQFVPDMQPSDLIGKDQINLEAVVEGGSPHPHDGAFKYWENGPLFHNIIVADEINRAPSKVQAALLESMQEKAITPFGKERFVIRSHAEWRMWLNWIYAQSVYRQADVWGSYWGDVQGAETLPAETLAVMVHAVAQQNWNEFGDAFPWEDRRAAGEETFGATPIDLRKPTDAQYAVFATMNPIELEGVFPLSEAQIDRFCFKTVVKYPSYPALQSITRMVNPPRSGHDPDAALLQSPVSAEDARRRALYFFRRCREILFGQPGNLEDSLLVRMFSGNGSAPVETVSKIVFYSHLRQPEGGSRRTQQLAQLMRDPEQIERQARLAHEDREHRTLLDEKIWQFVKSGASPRAQLFLAKAALCEMMIEGESDGGITARHIRSVAHDVLRHRIRMNVQAHVGGIQPEDVVDLLLQHFASESPSGR